VATNFEKFLKLLQELFQLAQADRDFGIYRIMNQKRDVVTRYFKEELPPKVKAAFEKYRRPTGNPDGTRRNHASPFTGRERPRTA
jgi:hypothetical protein